MRKFKLLTGAGCLLILSILTSCYYDNEEDLYPAVNTVACDTSVVTYAGTIKYFLDNKCATPGCHTPGLQSPDLSNFTSAAAAAGQLYAKASDANHASRFSWSSCDQAQLQIWGLNPQP